MMNGLLILPSFADYLHLNTASEAASSAIMWVGAAAIAPFGGPYLDKFGRKNGLLAATVITTVGVILQSAAVNAAMFMIGRFILGTGIGLNSMACPIYAAEIAPTKFRALMLGFYYDLFFLGGLIAALVTYRSAQIENTWSWRLPSIAQVVPSIFCVLVLPFIPESPRWLIAQGKNELAIKILAMTMSNGDTADNQVLTAYSQIVETIEHQKANPASQSWLAAVKTQSNRRRISLALSVAIIVNLSGSIIAAYWLGAMLSQAGVTDTISQLQINIALNVWCLVCACTGTYFADSIGRRRLAIGSLSWSIVLLYLVGALTKLYGTSSNKSAIYGTVACIFLFQGGFSLGWATLIVMYPPEVLSFSLRANGMAMYTFLSNAAGVFAIFVMPISLEHIGWKTYIINASFDILELAFIYFFWVETSKRSLEEIEVLFDEKMGLSIENVMEGDNIEGRKTSCVEVEVLPSDKLNEEKAART
ncbi:MFS sugar transporter-like protein [Ilyonectria destructans]|nr:MFS sugar transporter-like protein [Ilyonectria destructans]